MALPSVPKVIFCGDRLTVKDFTTGVAALYIESPACEACTIHWPVPIIVSVVQLIAQTDFVAEIKLTARPELAVAAMVSGPIPYVTALRGLKLIV